MPLLDLIIVLVALLLIWFAGLPIVPVFTVSVLVMIIVHIARGERIP